LEKHIHPIFDQLVNRSERESLLNQKSKVYWFTGLSGSGKSTIARGVERLLFSHGYFAQVIDGDNVRTGLCSNLSFSLEDRAENIRRVAELAKLYCNSGVITLCSFISPTREIRKNAKEIISSHDFEEIYINTPLEICEKRDVPLHPELEVKTENSSVEASVELVYNYIKERSR